MQKNNRQFCCENNHSFDIAREGYVNLLLANQKKSKDPGDSKQMVKSRRDFLGTGYYDEISNALNTQIEKLLPTAKDDFRILDIGCGEGFFLWKLRDDLADNSLPLSTYGLDISKSSVRYAAKRDQKSNFAVASLYQMPIRNASLHCVTRIFAPKSYREFSRILQATGTLITIVPGAQHLMSLKQLIYQNPRPHSDEQDSELDKFFALREKISINYKIALVGQENIANLITMTPYYWRISHEVDDTLKELTELQVEVHCRLNVYEKRNT